MGILENSETLLNREEACEAFRCSRTTFHRYTKVGIRAAGGKIVVLESILRVGRRYTSQAAFDRFTLALSKLQPHAERHVVRDSVPSAAEAHAFLAGEHLEGSRA